MPVRVGLLALGIVLLGLLVVARQLEPNPAGFGTHRQLGFSECTMFAWTGRPCPTCGMTTAWAWLVRGHVHRAVDANLAGTLVGILAVVAIPWSLISGCLGRWIGIRPREDVMITTVLIIAVCTLADWLRRGAWNDLFH